MTKIEQLHRDIEKLPEEAQDFLLDFVAFLKQRYLPTGVPNNAGEQSKTSEEQDPLIGLFNGSPNLSTDAENILQGDIQTTSGWTWKSIWSVPFIKIFPHDFKKFCFLFCKSTFLCRKKITLLKHRPQKHFS